MNFLFDTNILIPLESDPSEDSGSDYEAAAQLASSLGGSGHGVFIHPAIEEDISRDADEERAALRRFQITKNQHLPNSPEITDEYRALIGNPDHGTNDWVDANLLAAVEKDAIDILVTEDVRLRAKSTRLGIADRVLTISDALSLVESLFPQRIPTPPLVDQVKAHVIPDDASILNGLREDYPGFDEWLARAKREHRDAFIVGVDDDPFAAIALVKHESTGEFDLSRNSLKISTFKVADEQYGQRFGELLLKSIFLYARAMEVDQIYVTVLSKFPELIDLLQEFGFSLSTYMTDLGEHVLVKDQNFNELDRPTIGALEFNRRYGPDRLRLAGENVFIVPVQPSFHRLLFPDSEDQGVLSFSITPPGNAIRKAYLSHAPTRLIEVGDTVLFYRSAEKGRTRAPSQFIKCVGVVEGILVSDDPNLIARTVGKRTIYTYEDIVGMCDTSVLTLMFRHALILKEPISLEELKANSNLTSAPQSITKIDRGSAGWIRMRLAQ